MSREAAFAAPPQRGAGERQIEFLGLMRMGGIFDAGAEQQEADGEAFAGDRAAQADQLGPAVALQKFRAEIRRAIGLAPFQRWRGSGERLRQGVGCRRGEAERRY